MREEKKEEIISGQVDFVLLSPTSPSPNSAEPVRTAESATKAADPVAEKVEAELKESEAPERQAPQVKEIPTIKFYQKTYATSCGNNDPKAMKLFKEYENRDKMQRLKVELLAISRGNVSDELCARTVGAIRKGRHQSYAKWAIMMLNLLNAK